MKESVKQIWCQLNQGIFAEGNFIILQVQILLLYNNIDVDCVNMIKWHNRPN